MAFAAWTRVGSCYYQAQAEGVAVGCSIVRLNGANDHENKTGYADYKGNHHGNDQPKGHEADQQNEANGDLKIQNFFALVV